jgi:hypothetical protein
VKIVGLMPVRNEDWCLGLSVRVALRWCDVLVVGLHACTDNSADIVYELQREDAPLIILRNTEPEWHEMNHRQALLEAARKAGATHIALVDADEIQTGNSAPSGISQHWMMREPLYNLRGGISKYHANGIWGNRETSVLFADDPALHWGGDTFHQREPLGKHLPQVRAYPHGQAGTMHLWGANERRLRAKHALYKLTETLRWPEKPIGNIDRMYSWAIHGEQGHARYGTPATWTYADVPEAWWAPYADWMQYLDLSDRECWQEAEVRRLIAEHGKYRFAGLDLFGVAS